ncbi:MAG TPA: glycosyltransferase family 4 protein [Candidatus Limnocylindrales bacterium]|nr:glycosyltransferase family 4 protein [Candidatus Limnocylindrales bacterium]
MRIGIYDPYLDDLGGGEKYMMTAAVCLSKKHNVSVFWDNQEDIEKLVKRFSFDFNGISFTKNIFSKKVGFLERLRATKKYDAIVLLSDGSIPFVMSKKLFIHLQQPLEKIGQSSTKDRLKLSRINAVFYNSEFTKSFNEKKIPGIKSLVIYPPVDLIEKNIKKENIILNVGRFRVINLKNNDYKKQQVMVDVFKKMIDKGLSKWRFVVAVSINDKEDPKFKEMTASAKGYPIEFLINKTNKDLWDVYNKARIYWHASGFGEDLEKHPEYAEHFGISTVEAMGSGAVPVVVNAGGQKEIIENGKDGFLWETLSELEERTKLLMGENSIWEKMSNHAKIKAKDFSKEKFCQEIEQLLVS